MYATYNSTSFNDIELTRSSSNKHFCFCVRNADIEPFYIYQVVFAPIVVDGKEELELPNFVLVHSIEFYAFLVSFFQLFHIPYYYPIISWAIVEFTITSDNVFNSFIVTFPVRVSAKDCITLIYCNL